MPLKDTLERLRADPEIHRCATKLDLKAFGEQVHEVMAGLAAEYSFDKYRRAAQSMKVQFDGLPKRTEEEYLKRAELRLDSHKALAAAARKLQQLLHSSGFDALFSTRSQELFALLQDKSCTNALWKQLADLGASPDDLSAYRAYLRVHLGNPLEYDGLGSLSAVFKAVQDGVPQLQQELDTVRKHGVPRIIGQDNKDEALIVILIIVFILICLLVPPCNLFLVVVA